MDYNIYIHDKTNGGSASHTKAWQSGSNSKTSTEEQSDKKMLSNLSKVAGVINNPDSIIGSVVGMAKTVPFVAAAYIVLTTAAKITEEQINYIARETGDYRASVWWSNTKSGLSAALHPFATAKSMLENRQEVSLYNKRQEQQRLLAGESFVNSSIRRV